MRGIYCYDFQVRKHVYHDSDNLDTAFDAGKERCENYFVISIYVKVSVQ